MSFAPPPEPQKRAYGLLSNFRFIADYLRQWAPQIIPLIFIAAFAQVLSPYIAIFLPKLVIDALSSGTDATETVRTIVIASLLLLLMNIARDNIQRYTQLYVMSNRSKFGILVNEKTLTTDYAHIENPKGQRARLKAHEAVGGNSSGAEAMIITAAQLFSHLLGLLLYAGTMRHLSPALFLFIVCGAAIGFLATRRAQRHEAAQMDDYIRGFQKTDYIYHQAVDIRNAKDIRAYNMFPWLDQLMTRFTEVSMNSRDSVFKSQLSADIVHHVVALFRDGFAYFYLIRQVLQGQITPGDFSLYFAAVAGISNWIHLIANDINLIDKASLEIGYLRSFLDQPDRSAAASSLPFSSQDIEKTTLSLPQTQHWEIVFENVSFRYPDSDQWVLRHFNLHIAAGEKMALVGINGAGKTTCVKLMTGLYQPSEGRVLLNGQDIQKFDRDAYFRLFSAVFQESQVLAMDLRRNVALKPKGDIDEHRVESVLRTAGLSERVAEMPNGLDTELTRLLYEEGIELSGGQTQKLLLARALYKDAPIIIMDEPTASLDPIAESELYQQYNDMVGGRTSLYISHRLASTRFCDRIAFLAKGQVSELGSHDELMQLGGAYAQMFEIQAHYYRQDIKAGGASVDGDR